MNIRMNIQQARQERIIFTKTAMAELDFLEAQYHQQETVSLYRTRWAAMHDIIEALNLGISYVKWQWDTFGGKSLRQIMEDRNKSNEDWDLWNNAFEWYIDEHKKESQVLQEQQTA